MLKVSVIIPTYNRAHLIAEAIQSVLDQTFTDFEIIVVDDGSTDNTKQVVDGFKDPHIKYIYQENRGVAAARNNAIKASRGEYLAFLDSDDKWLPENLDLKVKLLESRPDVSLVSSDYYLFDNDPGATLDRFWDNRSYRYLINIVEGSRQPIALATLLSPSVALMRRHVFDEVGYFDESLYASSDWDMWLRIIPRFLIKMIDLPLARMRLHHAQITTSKPDVRYLAGVTALNRGIRDDRLSREDVKFLKRKLAGKYLDYGWYMITSGEINTGRKNLLVSIKVSPWRIRPYIYLAASILGSRGIVTLNQRNKKRERSINQHRLSSDTE